MDTARPPAPVTTPRLSQGLNRCVGFDEPTLVRPGNLDRPIRSCNLIDYDLLGASDLHRLARVVFDPVDHLISSPGSDIAILTRNGIEQRPGCDVHCRRRIWGAPLTHPLAYVADLWWATLSWRLPNWPGRNRPTSPTLCSGRKRPVLSRSPSGIESVRPYTAARSERPRGVKSGLGGLRVRTVASLAFRAGSGLPGPGVPVLVERVQPAKPERTLSVIGTTLMFTLDGAVRHCLLRARVNTTPNIAFTASCAKSELSEERFVAEDFRQA